MRAYVICAETTCHKYQYSEVLDTGVPVNFFSGLRERSSMVGVSRNPYVPASLASKVRHPSIFNNWKSTPKWLQSPL
jgi:hypothetical protein